MSSAPQTTGPPSDLAGRVPLFERGLFCVLLAVLCARPLISESFQRIDVAFLGVVGAAEGVTPAATAWLDSLALTAATAALLGSRARGSRAGWVVAGAALLTAAIVVSVLAAGDRRLALNGGASLLIGVLCGAALVALMREAWMPRLLLAALLATACASAVKCVAQRCYEFDDTLRYWQEHKEQLAPTGVNPDDPLVVNFERRMKSHEAFGYQPHPNVTGSLLMMGSVVAVGLLAAGLVGRNSESAAARAVRVALSTAACAVLVYGTWLTGSLGAMLSAAVSVLLLLGLHSARARVARRAGLTTALLAGGYLAVIAGGAAWGLAKGTLPHPSLAFRWYYWTAAARAFEHTPLTGLGRVNFADAYLLYKPPQSTEDVRDPHNLWISLLVELGPLGLIAGGLLIAGCMQGALRRLATIPVGAVAPGPARAPVMLARPAALPTRTAWAATSAAAVLVLQLLFSGVLFTPAVLPLWLIELAAVWGISFLVFVRLQDCWAGPWERGGWAPAALMAALAGALVHGLLDFALLTPAGLSVFVAMAACALTGPPKSPAARASTPLSAKLAGITLVIAHLLLVTVPSLRVDVRLAQLRQIAVHRTEPMVGTTALSWGDQVLAADPLDAGAAREVARITQWLAGNPALPMEEQRHLLLRAAGYARLALARNPHSSSTYVRLATIHQDLEEVCLLNHPEEAATALRSAAGFWQAAVELQPNDPRLRIAAAKTWVDWWDESHDAATAQTAREHLLAAQRIDAARPPGDVARLRPQELRTIQELMRALGRDDSEGPQGSAPATRP